MSILRTNEVINITGLSRSTLWRLEKIGEFPKRLQLSKNSIGWLEEEIEEWVNSRPRITNSVLDNT